MIEHSPVYTATLMRHPGPSGAAVRGIEVRVSWLQAEQTGGLALTYMLTGDCAQLRIPPLRRSAQVDGLWRHTCFEAFVSALGAPAYRECNFSPSGEWAVYHFRGYRDRMTLGEEEPAPRSIARSREQSLELDACIPLPLALTTQPLRLALSAVIEDHLGGLSYWALRHPPGKLDFHHADGFALEIAPPCSETIENTPS